MKFWSPEKNQEKEERKPVLKIGNRAKTILMGGAMLSASMVSAQEASSGQVDTNETNIVHERVESDEKGNIIKTKTYHPKEDVWGERSEEEPKNTSPEVVKTVETEKDSTFKLIEGDRYIAIEMNTENFDGFVMITGEGFVKIPEDKMKIKKGFEIDDYLIDDWKRGLSKTQKERVEVRSTELVILKEIEASGILSENQKYYYQDWLKKEFFVLDREVGKYLTTENQKEDEIKEDQNIDSSPSERRIEKYGLAISEMVQKYGPAKFIRPGVVQFKKGYVGFVSIQKDQMSSVKEVHSLTMANKDLIDGNVIRIIDEKQTQKPDGTITYIRVYKMIESEE